MSTSSHTLLFGAILASPAGDTSPSHKPSIHPLDAKSIKAELHTGYSTSSSQVTSPMMSSSSRDSKESGATHQQGKESPQQKARFISAHSIAAAPALISLANVSKEMSDADDETDSSVEGKDDCFEAASLLPPVCSLPVNCAIDISSIQWNTPLPSYYPDYSLHGLRCFLVLAARKLDQRKLEPRCAAEGSEYFLCICCDSTKQYAINSRVCFQNHFRKCIQSRNPSWKSLSSAEFLANLSCDSSMRSLAQAVRLISRKKTAARPCGSIGDEELRFCVYKNCSRSYVQTSSRSIETHMVKCEYRKLGVKTQLERKPTRFYMEMDTQNLLAIELKLKLKAAGQFKRKSVEKPSLVSLVLKDFARNTVDKHAINLTTSELAASVSVSTQKKLKTEEKPVAASVPIQNNAVPPFPSKFQTGFVNPSAAVLPDNAAVMKYAHTGYLEGNTAAAAANAAHIAASAHAAQMQQFYSSQASLFSNQYNIMASAPQLINPGAPIIMHPMISPYFNAQWLPHSTMFPTQAAQFQLIGTPLPPSAAPAYSSVLPNQFNNCILGIKV
jgi:hypothetical protein